MYIYPFSDPIFILPYSSEYLTALGIKLDNEPNTVNYADVVSNKSLLMVAEDTANYDSLTYHFGT